MSGIRDDDWQWDPYPQPRVAGDYPPADGPGLSRAGGESGRHAADPADTPPLTVDEWRQQVLDLLAQQPVIPATMPAYDIKHVDAMRAEARRASGGDTLTHWDVESMCLALADLIMERHQKYGPRNIANAPGGAMNGLLVRMTDKLARLENGLGNYADESVEDTLMDIAGYAVIGLLVRHGKWPGAK